MIEQQAHIAPETESVQQPKVNYPTALHLLALLGVFFAATVVAAFCLPMLEAQPSVSRGLAVFVTYVFQFGVTILFALWQKVHYNHTFKGLLRFSLRKATPTLTLWGVLAVSATGIVIEPLLNLFPQSYFDQLSSIMGSGGWMMLTAVVAAPILEEVLFRGIVQESLTQRKGAVSGILIASTLFAVIHINPPQVVNAFFVAVIMGFIYYKTESLVPVIFIHAVNNTLAYFGWMISGGELTTLREVIANDTIYYIVYGVAFLLFSVACVEMFRGLRTKKEPAALEG